MADKAPTIQAESNRVMFEMVDGKLVRLPPSYRTLHDPTGAALPKCDVFFAPIKRTSQKVDMGRAARRYFGPEHRGVIAILPRVKDGPWKVIGRVAVIYYARLGKRAPGGFNHPFKSRQPTLSKSSRGYYKLSLGQGCLVDDRGYVFP